MRGDCVGHKLDAPSVQPNVGRGMWMGGVEADSLSAAQIVILNVYVPFCMIRRADQGT